jgi:LPS export ABC transporter protein LptC
MTNIKRHISRLFSFCSISIILVLIFNSCEEKLKPPILTDLGTGEIPAQESWNSTITFSDSGMIRAVLKVGHVKYFSKNKEYLLEEGVIVDFFNRNGQHSSVLTSKSATVDDNTRNMEAFGNVKIVSDSGTIVKTERMRWINATQRLFGDQFVTIDSKTETIQGYGFESDQNLKDYTIKKVSGQLSTDNVTK